MYICFITHWHTCAFPLLLSYVTGKCEECTKTHWMATVTVFCWSLVVKDE